LPWNSRWFYGDFVFIIDPFMWLVLGGACFLLTAKKNLQIVVWLLLVAILTYLILAVPAQRGLEYAAALQAFWVVGITVLVISARLGVAQRWGRRIALASFAIVTLYCGSLAFLHLVAVSEVQEQARAIASQNGESVTDVAAMPTLANPFQWLCVVETELAAYRFEMSLINGQNGLASLVRHERADTSSAPVVEQASKDRRAQIFLGFARFPVVRLVGADCLTETLVQFADLRYTQPGSARGSFSLELPVDCPIQKGINEEVDE
jgi:inner membrane protein